MIHFLKFNLLCELRPTLPSSIVFSPLEFEDEETNFVINKLEEGFHYVKKLVGEDATSYNIDNHVKEYPYEILHICSHGGEVEGSHLIEQFTDRDGN
jgi:CHAT domain-containing protein